MKTVGVVYRSLEQSCFCLKYEVEGERNKLRKYSTKTVCFSSSYIVVRKQQRLGTCVLSVCRWHCLASRVKAISKIWKKRSPASPDGHKFTRCHTIRARFGLRDIFTMKKLACMVANCRFGTPADSSLWYLDRTKIFTIRSEIHFPLNRITMKKSVQA